MGTRALIHVKEGNKQSKTLVTIYVHNDGSPEYLGREILKIIDNKQISNGVRNECFNGSGCLAATLIKELKGNAGGVYIMLPDTSDVWEEFVYTIYHYPHDSDNHNLTHDIYIDISGIDLESYIDERDSI